MFKSTKLILILSCSFLFSSLAQSTLAYDYGYYTITTSDDTICDDIDELVRSTAKDLAEDVAYSYTGGRIGFDCFESLKLYLDSNVLVLVPFYEQQVDEFYLKKLEPEVVVKLLNKGLLVSCSENGVQGVCTPIDDKYGPEGAPPRSLSESGFAFPDKPFHSMDEIKTYMRMIKPYRELITIIQRSIYRNFPSSEQKRLGEIFVDGQWGDGTQEALKTALQMADGFEISDKISADVIKTILFSAFINTDEKVSSAGVDPNAIHGPTNNLTAKSDTDKTGDGVSVVPAVVNSEVEELTQKILDLKTELNSEQERVEELRSKVAAMGVQTIRQLLDAVEKITVNGKTKNGEDVEINNKGIDYARCSSLNNLDYSIRDAKLNWHKSGCVEYNVGDLDVDKVTVDDSGIVTVALQEKQAQYITSIKSDTLPALKGLSANCYVDLETQSDGKSESSPVKVYLNKVPLNDDDLYFTDHGAVKDKKMLWEGLNFKLTLPDNEGQKCQLTNDVAIPITTKDKVEDRKAPHAIISREGEVTLKNLPITKIVGRDLVVFLDTYVGTEGSERYAFNAALVKTDAKDVQKTYFRGFMKGLEEYLRVSNEFQRVKIFTSNEDKSNDFELIIQSDKEENDVFQEELFSKISSHLENNFRAGIKGNFSDKKVIYNEVLGENPNTTFLSFGSSGKTADAVCNDIRGDFRAKSYIFDIVTTSVMEKLDKTKATNKFGKEFYECVGIERVYGMREGPYLELELITGFINKRLIADLD